MLFKIFFAWGSCEKFDISQCQIRELLFRLGY